VLYVRYRVHCNMAIQWYL